MFPIALVSGSCHLQGDIEKVASRSPEQLTQLFEQISGSDVLAKPYEVGARGLDGWPGCEPALECWLCREG
jgi:hypothetical protein